MCFCVLVVCFKCTVYLYGGSVDRDKAAKFVELANKRVNKALKDIKLVSNLSNRQNYEYTEEQAKKIVKVLQQEVEQLKHSFLATDESGSNTFKL